MEEWSLAFGWGSPIGVGIFLLCLGGMIYLFSKAGSISKYGRWKEKEKEQEKK
jgi:hypothetical protein